MNMNYLYSKILLLFLCFVLFSPSLSAQKRYLTFTDASGKEHTFELHADSRVSTFRDDTGSTQEVWIGYERGELFAVGTFRPSNTALVLLDYEGGVFHGAGVYRENSSIEADISYKDGALSSVATYRENESVIAGMTFENGMLYEVGSFRADDSAEMLSHYKGSSLLALGVYDSENKPLKQIAYLDRQFYCE